MHKFTTPRRLLKLLHVISSNLTHTVKFESAVSKAKYLKNTRCRVVTRYLTFQLKSWSLIHSPTFGILFLAYNSTSPAFTFQFTYTLMVSS